MHCEIPAVDGRKKKCAHPASMFALGVWRCAAHLPPPQPNCSHSLAPSGRCCYCGQEVS